MDLEKDSYSGCLDKDFPHEFYNVRRAVESVTGFEFI